MIQAKDLRFGNKVCNQAGNVITIQQILPHTIVYDSRMQVDSDENEDGEFSMLTTATSKMVEVVQQIEYSCLQPIPLTPELLVKYGFRNFMRDEWILSHGRSHTDFEFKEDGLRLKQPPSLKVCIKYLHQLQNLFYALTGEDLEPKY